MVEVICRNEALDHLYRSAGYIRQFDAAAAERIVKRLIERRQLGRLAHRGRTTPWGQRQMALVPTYVLTYVVEEGAVSIARIRHGAQRPQD